MAGFTLEMDEQDLLDAVDQQLNNIADFILAKSQENIIQQDITDRGTLLQSGNVVRERLKKTVVYSVPYADTIEFGRLPGSMPPVTNIQGWVFRKLGIKDVKKQKQIAWAIAQDIKKKGDISEHDI